MASLLFCLLALISGQNINSDKSTAALRKEPVVMLTEFNPWAMVVGSDTPSFVLYSDGTVIFWSKAETSGRYLTTKLSANEMDGFVAGLHIEELNALADSYSVDEGTDAPTNALVLRATAAPSKTISIYGSIRLIKDNQVSLPESLKADLIRLDSYNNPAAVPWAPDRVEVIVWPFDYARGASLKWPSDWPGIHAPATVKRKQTYSIFLPSADLPRLQKLLASRKETQAMLIDGRKWACSVRFPFPHEN
jgi:hypothetical protein